MNNDYQVTSVCLNDTAEQVISGGIDNDIKVWDIRKNEVLFKLKGKFCWFIFQSVSFPNIFHFPICFIFQYVPLPRPRHFQFLPLSATENSFKNWKCLCLGHYTNSIKFPNFWNISLFFTGHTDTVTGLSLSPCGSFVLSNSMDNTCRIWDIRPYCPTERCRSILQGHSHNFEKNLLRCSWSKDGNLVAAGSADRFVYVWDVHSKKILYKLPGHTGSVNEIDFHPKEPIILSASSDKTLFMGELDNW